MDENAINENNDHINDGTIQTINSMEMAMNKLRETVQQVDRSKKDLKKLQQEREEKEEFKGLIVDRSDYYTNMDANSDDSDNDTYNERSSNDDNNSYQVLRDKISNIKKQKVKLKSDLDDLKALVPDYQKDLLDELLSLCTHTNRNEYCSNTLSKIFGIYCWSLLKALPFRVPLTNQLPGMLVEYLINDGYIPQISYVGEGKDQGISIILGTFSPDISRPWLINDAGRTFEDLIQNNPYGVIRCNNGEYFSRNEDNSIILQLVGSMVNSRCNYGMIISSESCNKTEESNRKLQEELSDKEYKIEFLFIEDITNILNIICKSNLQSGMLEYFVNCLQNNFFQDANNVMEYENNTYAKLINILHELAHVVNLFQ